MSFLDVPGARLYYELRGEGPLVALVGAPMDARAFGPLAELLAGDFTVLTTDPRGINRSTVEDRDQDSTPELRADDLSRLIAHADAGPAIVFGSSGGAVTTLALAQSGLDHVAAVIAHEPPVVELLDDRDALRAQTDALIARYLSGDVLGAWGQFWSDANIDMPKEVLEAMFGGDREPQTVADERFWFEHEMRPSTSFRPDFDALRASSTRVMLGIGAESSGQTCDLTTRALAASLAIKATIYPGGHTGFVDRPDQFAQTLRKYLAREVSTGR